MGTDAKIKLKSSGETFYVDRESNIKNVILESYKVESYIAEHGIPVYLMRDIILDMEDFSGAELYTNILDWLKDKDPLDYVKLVNEHTEEYFNN